MAHVRSVPPERGPEGGAVRRGLGDVGRPQPEERGVDEVVLERWAGARREMPLENNGRSSSSVNLSRRPSPSRRHFQQLDR